MALAASSSASRSARKERILTRDDIEALIAEGRHVVIHNGRVLKVDAWLKYHPGGDKAIKHMVGRDATDEMEALHSPEAKERMNAYVIGKIVGPWTSFLPPIQGGQFRTREEIEAGNPCQLDLTESESDVASSQPSSEESSPIFDPADRLSSLRKRNIGTSVSRSSSATSISSLGIEGEEVPIKAKETEVEKNTRREIERDLAKYPSLDAKTQAGITEQYRLLNQRIKAEGLYQCNYTSYGIEIIRYTFLFGMSMLMLKWGQYALSGLFLGAFWHQLVFTAHDAGHMGITHKYHVDTVIGMIVADFCGGLSLGWWKRSHNVHHIVTNHPEHDPDIELMPFFAITSRFFESLRSTYHERILEYDAVARFAVRYQHWLYYPILTLGRFNLYLLSWEHLLVGRSPRNGPAWWHRWFEITGQVFFWTWYGYGILYCTIPTWTSRIIFVLISNMVTMPLHVQITLSHYAMSTADLGVAESFPQRMLRTTMDVDCPQWLDFFHGGLQFQAIHHLYPRIPRHNLRRTQKLVQQFCADVGIPYALLGFVEGNKEVISHLGDVAKQARILAECQKHVVESGELLHGH